MALAGGRESRENRHFLPSCRTCAVPHGFLKCCHPTNPYSYIPDLAEVNPNLFAVAVCDTNGNQWSIGDNQIEFTLQSTIKPLLYCVAQSIHGPDFVHEVSAPPMAEEAVNWR